MENSNTYEVTCGSTKATQTVLQCYIEKEIREDYFKMKLTFDTAIITPERDEYTKMVTNASIVGKACQATFISDIDEKDHIGKSL